MSPASGQSSAAVVDGKTTIPSLHRAALRQAQRPCPPKSAHAGIAGHAGKGLAPAGRRSRWGAGGEAWSLPEKNLLHESVVPELVKEGGGVELWGEKGLEAAG